MSDWNLKPVITWIHADFLHLLASLTNPFYYHSKLNQFQDESSKSKLNSENQYFV